VEVDSDDWKGMNVGLAGVEAGRFDSTQVSANEAQEW